MKLFTCSGALGIQLLRWNSFQQTGTAAYVPLTATLTPESITVLLEVSGGHYGVFKYRFSNAAKLPGWIRPGAAVKIDASVTLDSVSYDVSGWYIVSGIDETDGLYFDVPAPRPHSSGNPAAFTKTVVETALDDGSPGVTPLVTLNIQAQKVMFSGDEGVLIAPNIDTDGVADCEIDLSGGSYEVTAQPGSKFDLADWYMKGNTKVLTVRFL